MGQNSNNNYRTTVIHTPVRKWKLQACGIHLTKKKKGLWNTQCEGVGNSHLDYYIILHSFLISFFYFYVKFPVNFLCHVITS